MTPTRVPQATSARLVFIFMFLSFLYLYANLFWSPRTPFLLTGDQTYFWTDGQRMLSGELPYRDFFQFTPPGTDFFYFALFKVFGARIWVTNATVLALGLLLTGICLSICRQIMKAPASFLCAAMFLTLVYGKLLNATHHWFSMLCILCAIRVAMAGLNSLNILIAGTLLGLAAFFTHTHALAATLAVVIFIFWTRQRVRHPHQSTVQSLGILCAGFAIAWLICNFYLLETVGFRQLWYYQITFVRRFVVNNEKGAFLGLPEAPSLSRLPALTQYFLVYAIVAIAPLVSLWRCSRRNRDDQHGWEKIALLSLLGFLLAVEVAFNVNWLRVYAISLPAIVVAIYLLEDWEYSRRYLPLLWIGVVGLAVLQTVSRHRGHFVVTELPGGRAALVPQAYEKVDWVKRHTRPGDLFFQSLVPTMYLPLALHSPVFVEGLGTGEQTRPEFIQRTISEIEKKPVRYVLWSHHLDSQITDPGETDPLPPFRTFLSEHFTLAWTFTDQDEIWERK